MKNNINKAVKLLNAAELVAIPTETVYGLAADATNEKAVRKIFKTKNRPINHPVIVHIYSVKQLKDWVDNIPDVAKKLMKQYWPGPLTLVFKAKKNISKLITGGQDTIGIRMPSHLVARKLLKAFGKPLAAPSANRFGRISPTTSAHVKEELGEKIKLILEGGKCKVGIESTIVDVTQSPARLLRPGILNIKNIKVIKKNKNAPRVSGSLKSHYAPETPVVLVREIPPSPPFSKGGIPPFEKGGSRGILKIGVMSSQAKPKNFSGIWITMPKDPKLYAQKLYATLRKLDAMKLTKIYVQKPLSATLWVAVMDRLVRAAAV